jgi:1-acyl-sn-glycerol-3-phosphate acyltransferase
MRFFRMYTRNLFRRRFRKVYYDGPYSADSNRSTLYYMNHASWWDALIPFLLNEYHFRQNARALMDLHQLKRYPFFRKIGVFSVDRENARSALHSLNRTREWLEGENNSIYLFPQGGIRNEFSPIVFEHGIGWLAKSCRNCDIVPLAIHINSVRGDKPDLFLRTGNALEINYSDDKKAISDKCRLALEGILNGLRSDAYDESRELTAFP